MISNAIYVDVETTGLDPAKDRICQVAAVCSSKTIYETIDPEVNISREASEIHGLTNDTVKGKKKFKDICTSLYELIQSNKIFIAFNSTFDFSFLKEEFKRCGLELNYSDFTIVDPLKIHRYYHKTDLKSLYKFYTGIDLDNHHDSLSDITATSEILREQLIHFPEVADIIDGKKTLDNQDMFTNWFKIEGKKATFKKGKYRLKRVMKVVKEDPEYLIWINDNVNNLTIEDKRILTKAISVIKS